MEINWIDFNGFWGSVSSCDYERIELNPEKEIVKELNIFFGKDLDEEFDKVSELYDQMTSESYKVKTKNEYIFDTQDRLIQDDPKYILIKQYEEFSEQWSEKLHSHPLKIEWEKKADEWAINQKSFIDLQLNEPGILVEVECKPSNKIYLLGDLSAEGGTCDHCCSIESTRKVLRYAEILELKELLC